MAYTFNMIAPAAGFNIVSQGGTSYTADASGLISGINSGDVNSLEASGCLFAGNLTQPLSLTQFLVSSGQPLPSVASSGVLGLSCVPGTNITLLGELASSNTKTDYAVTEFIMPPAYLAGSPFNIIINAQWTSSGSTSSASVVPTIYKTPVTGQQVSSENLVLTSAKQVTSSAANYTFLVNGTPSSGAVVGGQRLLLQLTSTLTNTSGTNTMQINSVAYQIA